ncbi:dihydrolipoamide acetyltransferase family protein [Nocardioides bigeumensis]|uniref:Dihydrolipoamide acetyltransferase component of pyruvate dehydrogenase complex n=1 Tax=Nocardioides bigeumensis TaxID=433657 RepID=A0ABP5K5E1_9ACTN
MARLAIRMPKMSMTMTEGEVNGWSVKVGDEIAVGDVVAEVMTDKVDMEVEATVAGTLVEIVVESGIVEVGEPIGWVEGEDDGGGFGDLLAAPVPEPVQADAAAEPDQPAAEEEPPSSVVEEVAQATVPSPQEADSGPIPAVPRARGLAREHGIDLETVTPTGPEGLVRVSDVEQALPTGGRAASEASGQSRPPAPVSAPAATAAAVPTDKAQARRVAVRRAVARVMVPTAAIPQFTVWREIHLDAANARRNGLSWTTVLLRAYAAALREVPELLSRWEDDQPTTAGPPSIALAVATDRGLLVPVFAEPDLGDARDKDAEVREVVRAAQGGKVDGAYMAVANGSLSNLGGAGVDRFQALLTPPQASVLSLGSIRPRPVAVPGGLGVALTVEAGVTVDHRVADGAHGADLLARFAELLDVPPA